MKFANLNGTTLRYRVSGDQNGPALIFVNSLGTDLTMWDEVVEQFPAEYRIIGYDKRGHGLSALRDSELPEGRLRISDLANDLLALADHLNIAEFAVCGVSVGGMIAQTVAAIAPERVSGIVLCNTGAKIGPAPVWDERIAAIKADGLAAQADTVMERWFTPAFREAESAKLAGYRAMLAQTSTAGYLATCAAIRDADLTKSSSALKLPVLCIAGADDLATPPQMVQALSDLIEGAVYHEIPQCGHLPSVEQPDVCAALIITFMVDLEVRTG